MDVGPQHAGHFGLRAQVGGTEVPHARATANTAPSFALKGRQASGPFGARVPYLRRHIENGLGRHFISVFPAFSG